MIVSAAASEDHARAITVNAIARSTPSALAIRRAIPHRPPAASDSSTSDPLSLETCSAAETGAIAGSSGSGNGAALSHADGASPSSACAEKSFASVEWKSGTADTFERRDRFVGSVKHRHFIARYAIRYPRNSTSIRDDLRRRCTLQLLNLDKVAGGAARRRCGALRRAPVIDVAYLVYAGDRAVRRAAFFRHEL